MMTVMVLAMVVAAVMIAVMAMVSLPGYTCTFLASLEAPTRILPLNLTINSSRTLTHSQRQCVAPQLEGAHPDPKAIPNPDPNPNPN